MPTDRFGQPYWYPTLENGFVWEQKDDPSDDRFFDPDCSFTVNATDHSWRPKDTSQIRPHLFRDPNFKGIGCDMNQTEAHNRGFGWKEKLDFLDSEFKFLAKLSGGSTGKHLTMSGSTGKHSKDPCCEGTSYYISWDYNLNPSPFRFGKEQFHSEYTWKDYKTDTTNLNFKINTANKFLGFGLTRYNKTNEQGKKTVKLEAYFNPDPVANILNWIKIDEIEDKGGWGSKAKTCSAPNPDQIIDWAMPVAFRIKIQDPNLTIDLKNLSYREIDPAGSFSGGQGGGGSGGGTPSPTPSFGFVDLLCKRNINFEKSSSCSQGSGSNTSVIYTQLTQNGDSDLKGTGYRAGEEVLKTTSVLYNKTVITVKFYARKTGTPANNLFLRIRKKDGSIARDMGNVAPASVSTSTAGDETNAITITDTGNTYKMKLNDKVSLESDGSSSNYFSIFRHSSVSYDGLNSKRFTYEPSYASKDGDLKAEISGF